jgi:hypothetical protein
MTVSQHPPSDVKGHWCASTAMTDFAIASTSMAARQSSLVARHEAAS